jgi:hypothetical protein
MIDDRAPTISELHDMQVRAIHDRAESGIEPTHGELRFVHARLCWQMEQRVRTAMREQRDPMAAFKALIGAIGGELLQAAKRESELRRRVTELEADAPRTPKPKAKVRVRAQGVPQ